MKTLPILLILTFFSYCSSTETSETKPSPKPPEKKNCVSGNCIDGSGTMEYDNGERYIGEFSKSLPSGNGRYQYLNGHVYSGEFKDGKPNGYGTLYDKNKNVLYSGDWIDGKY